MEVGLKVIKYLAIIFCIILLLKDLYVMLNYISEKERIKKQVSNFEISPPDIQVNVNDTKVEIDDIENYINKLINQKYNLLRFTRYKIIITCIETSLKSLLLVLCFKFL